MRLLFSLLLLIGLIAAIIAVFVELSRKSTYDIYFMPDLDSLNRYSAAITIKDPTITLGMDGLIFWKMQLYSVTIDRNENEHGYRNVVIGSPVNAELDKGQIKITIIDSNSKGEQRATVDVITNGNMGVALSRTYVVKNNNFDINGWYAMKDNTGIKSH